LRRVGRLDEAAAALETLSRSDAGALWLASITRELERIAAARRPAHASAEPTTLPLTQDATDLSRTASAQERAA